MMNCCATEKLLGSAGPNGRDKTGRSQSVVDKVSADAWHQQTEACYAMTPCLERFMGRGVEESQERQWKTTSSLGTNDNDRASKKCAGPGLFEADCLECHGR